MCAWFLKIVFVQTYVCVVRMHVCVCMCVFVCVHVCMCGMHVCVCVCVHVCLSACLSVCLSVPRLLVTSGMIWMPYDWFKKSYSFYKAAIVGIVSRCGLSMDARCENQPNKHNVAVYMPSIHFNSSVKRSYISSKTEHFSYKGEHGMMHNEAFKRRPSFGYI